MIFGRVRTVKGTGGQVQPGPDDIRRHREIDRSLSRGLRLVIPGEPDHHLSNHQPACVGQRRAIVDGFVHPDHPGDGHPSLAILSAR